jgi:hypothetical protein
MNIFSEIITGLTYKGSLPANAVSSNEHLYGSQGKKHLDEPGAPGLLNQANTHSDYTNILSKKEHASNAQWNQQQQLAQMAANRRHA